MFCKFKEDNSSFDANCYYYHCSWIDLSYWSEVFYREFAATWYLDHIVEVVLSEINNLQSKFIFQSNKQLQWLLTEVWYVREREFGVVCWRLSREDNKNKITILNTWPCHGRKKNKSELNHVSFPETIICHSYSCFPSHHWYLTSLGWNL